MFKREARAGLGAALAAAALAAAPARAQAPSLSADFRSIMQWLSAEMVTPLAFNAGDTFPCPLLTKPGRGQLELTVGGGLVPLDTRRFPSLSVQTLNDLGIQNQFPKLIPVPDVTATLRYGLPWETDLAIRISNVTAPRMKLTPQMETKGQTNNFGLQFRKFLYYGRRNALSITGFYQYLLGTFYFYNRFENVELTETFHVNSLNSGSINWHLHAAGVNLVASRQYGRWIPFAGVGWNRSSGSLKGVLKARFDTTLIAPSLGVASSKPRQDSMRALFGVHLQREQGWDYYLSGEMLANHGFGRALNLHMGVMFPLRFGEARREASKVPRRLKDLEAGQPILPKDHLIFIH